MKSCYPSLEIQKTIIRRNAEIILSFCRSAGIEPFGIIKGFNAETAVTEAFVEAGYRTLGSSRLPHLKFVKEMGWEVQTLALRIPMLSEAEEVIEYADISLNSERETLAALDCEAARRGKIHKVILMRDLGDLREGIFDRDKLTETAEYVEHSLHSLHLYGIGANLTCYGSIIPTERNLSELADTAEDVEKRIGRKLEIISGGNTTSLPLIYEGKMPKAINNLRIGEANVLPCDLMDHWKTPIAGLSNDGFVLKAEIIEIGEKPTYPIGEIGTNCFGSYSTYQDRGVRKRAILALGAFDIGDPDKLIPVDTGITVLGASSDHLIIDIQDSVNSYRLGDIVSFTLHYQAMLFATASSLINKYVIQ